MKVFSSSCLYETACSPVLVALGLVAVTPTEAQAGVHFGFSFGFPAYYGASPTIAVEDTTRIIEAIRSTDLIGLTITTGIEVHIDITVTIIAKTL
jgi:hypothetical protein